MVFVSFLFVLIFARLAGIRLTVFCLALVRLILVLTGFLRIALSRLALLHILAQFGGALYFTFTAAALALLAFTLIVLRQVALNPAGAVLLVFLLVFAARRLLLFSATELVGCLIQQFTIVFILLLFLLFGDLFFDLLNQLLFLFLRCLGVFDFRRQRL